MNRDRSHDIAAVNPYIALTDVLINLVFILLFFAAAIMFLGRLGQEDIKYKSAQDEFKKAMTKEFSEHDLAWNDPGRNDPPGTQRWVFNGRSLFKEGTADFAEKGANAEGGEPILLRFARILNDHRTTWRRIRIEGHTIPPRNPDTPDDWALAASRAAAVARLLSSAGRIPSYFLSVAARAGQNPIFTGPRNNENERVEFIIEYSNLSAIGKNL